jgi:hypothetical protein
METKFCTVASDICGSSSMTKLAPCHSSGAENFEVASKFLENLCTPVVNHSPIAMNTRPVACYVNLLIAS